MKRKPKKAATRKRKLPKKLSTQARIACDLRRISSDLSELRQLADSLERAVLMFARGVAPLIYDLRRRPDEIGFDPDDFVVFDDLVKRATEWQ